MRDRRVVDLVDGGDRGGDFDLDHVVSVRYHSMDVIGIGVRVCRRGSHAVAEVEGVREGDSVLVV